ncbi:5005_t:CDS:2 [Cetraspora pellucida]|uniref:5005_t:CDS:1 n=1 Tax=Cetraspora pellucida TaxID=1433469 RepID=A0ACA9KRF6_9GLOM|nr:5005_t:CDS:2 [Cetraspora pellucida]
MPSDYTARSAARHQDIANEFIRKYPILNLDRSTITKIFKKSEEYLYFEENTIIQNQFLSDELVKSKGHEFSNHLETLADERIKLRQLLFQYKSKNIYNADEIRLFYQILPNQTLVQQVVSGKKQNKLQLIILLATNATELHKLKLLVIGSEDKNRKNFISESSENGKISNSEGNKDDNSNAQPCKRAHERTHRRTRRSTCGSIYEGTRRRTHERLQTNLNKRANVSKIEMKITNQESEDDFLDNEVAEIIVDLSSSDNPEAFKIAQSIERYIQIIDKPVVIEEMLNDEEIITMIQAEENEQEQESDDDNEEPSPSLVTAKEIYNAIQTVL